MASLLLPLLLAFMVSLAPAHGHSITAVLDGFPDYSVYSGYLSQTKVCDEIDSRETVTCLVLPNAAMSALATYKSAQQDGLRTQGRCREHPHCQAISPPASSECPPAFSFLPGLHPLFKPPFLSPRFQTDG